MDKTILPMGIKWGKILKRRENLNIHKSILYMKINHWQGHQSKPTFGCFRFVINWGIPLEVEPSLHWVTPRLRKCNTQLMLDLIADTLFFSNAYKHTKRKNSGWPSCCPFSAVSCGEDSLYPPEEADTACVASLSWARTQLHAAVLKYIKV